jgi:hypothetical protein
MFTDKASDKDTKRLELERLLVFMREGATVVAHAWIGWRATLMTCAALFRV